jgi:hypothetical protein
VIHLLHLEALLEAKRTIDGTAWLTDLVKDNAKGWLRIDAPSRPEKFLVSRNEPRFFSHERVPSDQLIVGDHTIVFNHPVYDIVSEDGVWRLENCVVVQTDPVLLLQGHGTNPHTLESMVLSMLELFNESLDDLRKEVKKHLKDDHSGHRHVSDNPNEIELPTGARLVHRVNQPIFFLEDHANWAVEFVVTKDSDDKGAIDVAKDSARRALAKRLQKIEYEERIDGSVEGHFPLWEPELKNKKPIITSNGVVKKSSRVRVTPDMVAGWTWFLPEKRADLTAIAIRPNLI